MEELKRLIKENNRLLKENNFMLNQLIQYINIKESYHHEENDDDFVRNILANLISTRIDLK